MKHPPALSLRSGMYSHFDIFSIWLLWNWEPFQQISGPLSNENMFTIGVRLIKECSTGFHWPKSPPSIRLDTSPHPKIFTADFLVNWEHFRDNLLWLGVSQTNLIHFPLTTAPLISVAPVWWKWINPVGTLLVPCSDNPISVSVECVVYGPGRVILDSCVIFHWSPPLFWNKIYKRIIRSFPHIMQWPSYFCHPTNILA